MGLPGKSATKDYVKVLRVSLLSVYLVTILLGFYMGRQQCLITWTNDTLPGTQ